jgi:hypothetical protein
MTDEQDKNGVNTAQNTTPPKRVVGKPFSKNDPRISKVGRPRVPKNAHELNKLLAQIAAEEITNPNTGEQVRRIDALLRSMFTSKAPADRQYVIDRMFGKIPQATDVTIEDKTIVVDLIEDD